MPEEMPGVGKRQLVASFPTAPNLRDKSLSPLSARITQNQFFGLDSRPDRVPTTGKGVITSSLDDGFAIDVPDLKDAFVSPS